MRPVLVATILVFCATPATAQTSRAEAGPSSQALSSWAGRLLGPRARAALRSPEASVRMDAARRLGRAGEPQRSVFALIEALSVEEDLAVRMAILGALARRGDESAVLALAQRLSEWGRDDREAALRAMGAIGGDDAVRVLVDWLGAADEGAGAVDGLVRIGAPAVPRLLRALQIPIASRNAAVALGRIADTRATIPLVSQLRRAPPAARVEMLRALGAIGDERASPAIVRALRDADPAAVSAALAALSNMAGAEHAQPVASLADRGTTEQRASALRALAVMDPVAAAPRLEAALTDEETPAILRSVALESLLSHPTEHSVGTLVRLLRSPQSRSAAADALARVSPGHGLAQLLEAAEEGRGIDPALALALRRGDGELPDDLVVRAHRHLAQEGSLRNTVLRALALDATVRPRLAELIRSEVTTERAHGALGSLLLGADATSLRPEIGQALIRESDPAVFRLLAMTALQVGAALDPARIDARWWDPSTAPEALWLAGAHLGSAARRTQRRARRAMRRSLRAAQPRVRAGAALALAIARDRNAWRALVAALGDEHDSVRLAVARALESLGDERANEALLAQARVEQVESVRHALLDAASSSRRRAPPAIRPGHALLYARVSTAAGLSRGPDLAVDVLLPDGRWLRTFALETGEVFLADLPAGEAEVQVRLDP